MLKISGRITLWYLTTTAFILITMAAAMYYIYDTQRFEAVDSDLKEYAEFLVSGLELTSADLSEAFDKLLERKDIPSTKPKPHRIALISKDSLIFETNALVNLDSLLDVLDKDRKASNSPTFRTLEVNNVNYRTYSIPINPKKPNQYQLIVITSLDRIYESLAELRYTLFVLIPIALLFAGFIGFGIARKSMAPIRHITETAAAISYHNLGQRVPLGKSEDELTSLARTFNAMISRLDDTFKSQKQFIADASHDIRTPLTVMQMELELIAGNNSLDTNTMNGIQLCLKEISRLNKLSDNLLLLARADAKQLRLNKKSIRLDELLLDCISEFNKLAASKNIHFKIEINEAITINADENMLRRVITNLLDNAVKYSYWNETVDISIKSGVRQIAVKINNKGLPIPKELQSGIFKRFQRGDSARVIEGFGLGLAIAKAIIEVHSGQINIESNEAAGTTIRFQLPFDTEK